MGWEIGETGRICIIVRDDGDATSRAAAAAAEKPGGRRRWSCHVEQVAQTSQLGCHLVWCVRGSQLCVWEPAQQQRYLPTVRIQNLTQTDCPGH